MLVFVPRGFVDEPILVEECNEVIDTHALAALCVSERVPGAYYYSDIPVRGCFLGTLLSYEEDHFYDQFHYPNLLLIPVIPFSLAYLPSY